MYLCIHACLSPLVFPPTLLSPRLSQHNRHPWLQTELADEISEAKILTDFFVALDAQREADAIEKVCVARMLEILAATDNRMLAIITHIPPQKQDDNCTVDPEYCERLS